ncbi:hypothetical protein FPV67DRAFT_1457289 [Lyophyllum atratum]|nr:hypothetical protein FPV67DRAFT_1457289 [Lyophyllum atratum]
MSRFSRETQQAMDGNSDHSTTRLRAYIRPFFHSAQARVAQLASLSSAASRDSYNFRFQWCYPFVHISTTSVNLAPAPQPRSAQTKDPRLNSIQLPIPAPDQKLPSNSASLSRDSYPSSAISIGGREDCRRVLVEDQPDTRAPLNSSGNESSETTSSKSTLYHASRKSRTSVTADSTFRSSPLPQPARGEHRRQPHLSQSLGSGNFTSLSHASNQQQASRDVVQPRKVVQPSETPPPQTRAGGRIPTDHRDTENPSAQVGYQPLSSVKNDIASPPRRVMDRRRTSQTTSQFSVDDLERKYLGAELVLIPDSQRGIPIAVSSSPHLSSALPSSANLRHPYPQISPVQRIKEEVQAMVIGKAEDTVPLDEVVISRKAKVEEEEEDEGDESDESEEEEWQHEAAAQLAAEASYFGRRGLRFSIPCSAAASTRWQPSQDLPVTDPGTQRLPPHTPVNPSLYLYAPHRRALLAFPSLASNTESDDWRGGDRSTVTTSLVKSSISCVRNPVLSAITQQYIDKCRGSKTTQIAAVFEEVDESSDDTENDEEIMKMVECECATGVSQIL